MMTDTSVGNDRAESSGHLARSRNLEIRLARTPLDVIGAQRLRYEVFYEEMGALASPQVAWSRLDFDELDAVCDHLLVIDQSRCREKIVGTYRLLSQDVASKVGGFYSSKEFEIDRLMAQHPGKRFLEVGRSCVHANYRKRRTIELLWHGLWTYIRQNKFDAMFGCASLPGADPALFADSIRLIQKEAIAPEAWKVQAVDGLGIRTGAFGDEIMHPKSALKALPPLIKAYMRLGAYFSEEMFVDQAFCTTDFLVTLPVTRIRERYFERFGAPDSTPDRLSH